MRKLGYIITRGKVRDVPKYIGVVRTNDEIVGFDGPILVIGIDEGKKRIENFSVLRFQFNEKLFWTFGKTENRERYDRDLSDFFKYCFSYAISKLSYYYVNPFTITRAKIKKLYKYLVNEGGWYIYKGDRMAYCYKEGNILGFSLEVLKYCGITQDRFERVLKSNRMNKVVFSDKPIGYDLKELIKNKKYATPYFLKENDDSKDGTDRCVCSKG